MYRLGLRRLVSIPRALSQPRLLVLPRQYTTRKYDGSVLALNITESALIEPTLKVSHQVYPLPEPPNRPTKWPTAWIQEPHTEEYLKPLYSHGWGVISTTAALGQLEGNFHAPQLARSFIFDSYSAAILFLSAIPQLEVTEKHHISLKFVHDVQSEVSVFLHTHTAIRPPWPEEMKSSEMVQDPGVTLRDIRFAILLERLYLQGPNPVPPKLRHPIERGSWTLLSQTFRSLHAADSNAGVEQKVEKTTSVSRKCASCGGEHDLTDCTIVVTDPANASPSNSRSTIRCLACHGLHHIQQCPFRNHVLPLKPCPQCGGMHWAIDCSKHRKKIVQRTIALEAEPPIVHLNSFYPPSPPIRWTRRGALTHSDVIR